MPDRRAMILDRLEILLANVTNAPAVTVFRNRPAMDEDERPCMVLLDGRETVHRSYEGRSAQEYARTGPYIMILRPQIFALLVRRDIASADEYAAELTQYRNAILRAVLGDEEIAALVGSNGDVAYRGHETDMEAGSSLWGEIRMDFVFYYPLDPSTI